MSVSSLCTTGQSIVAPGEPTIVVTYGRQARPAFVPLAVDEGLTGLALRLQRMNSWSSPSSEDFRV